jgi:conjugal transfer mating pair stabilization protein TraN
MIGLSCFALIFADFEEKVFELKYLVPVASEMNQAEEEKKTGAPRKEKEVITVHQEREIGVNPGRVFSMERRCSGHEEEMAHPAKKQVWLDSRNAAKKWERDVEGRFKRDSSIASVKFRIDGDGPCRVKALYTHRPDAAPCTNCSYAALAKQGPVPGKVIKRCLGHWVGGSADTHTFENAMKNKEKEERRYRQDPSIAAFKIYMGQHGGPKGKYRLDKAYRHVDDSPACNHYVLDPTTQTLPEEKSDGWAGSEERLSFLESDPKCRLAEIKNGNPETRTINGLAVTRDAWERELVFECDVSRERRELKSDFPEMAAALSSAFGLFRPGQEVTFESLNDPENPQLYQGERQSCRFFLSGSSPFDCCNGQSVDPRCAPSEKTLAEENGSGRCHFVGARKDSEGNTERVYCCFGTKMARIVQEQARKALGLGWGTAENPECRGLTHKEFGKISSKKIDLSEAYEDFPDDGEEMAKNLQKKIQSHLEKHRFPQ